MVETATRLTALLTMVTTYGVARNRHSGMIASQATLDDLFGC